jgi:transcriptional regulator with XRE-family HTH domain
MKLAIKHWRECRNMTQQTLADKIGKARSMIAEYESGTVSVSSDVLYALAQALEVSVNDLYATVDDPLEQGG